MATGPIPYIFVDPGGLDLRLVKSIADPLSTSGQFHDVTRTFGNESSASGNVGAWNWSTNFVISNSDYARLKARINQAQGQVNVVEPYGRIVVYNFLEKYGIQIASTAEPSRTRRAVPSTIVPNPNIDTAVEVIAGQWFLNYFAVQQGFLEHQAVREGEEYSEITLSFIETEILQEVA